MPTACRRAPGFCTEVFPAILSIRLSPFGCRISWDAGRQPNVGQPNESHGTDEGACRLGHHLGRGKHFAPVFPKVPCCSTAIRPDGVCFHKIADSHIRVLPHASSSIIIVGTQTEDRSAPNCDNKPRRRQNQDDVVTQRQQLCGQQIFAIRSTPCLCCDKARAQVLRDN